MKQLKIIVRKSRKEDLIIYLDELCFSCGGIGCKSCENRGSVLTENGKNIFTLIKKYSGE